MKMVVLCILERVLIRDFGAKTKTKLIPGRQSCCRERRYIPRSGTRTRGNGSNAFRLSTQQNLAGVQHAPRYHVCMLAVALCVRCQVCCSERGAGGKGHSVRRERTACTRTVARHVLGPRASRGRHMQPRVGSHAPIQYIFVRYHHAATAESHRGRNVRQFDSLATSRTCIDSRVRCRRQGKCLFVRVTAAVNVFYVAISSLQCVGTTINLTIFPHSIHAGVCRLRR